MKNDKRPAFTLIELLVVIALILVLAGLAARFIPTIGKNASQAQGGTMLQQWILTAKQKALRDQVPCGIRLMVSPQSLPFTDPSTGAVSTQTYSQVTQCVYIEKPDDFPMSSSSFLSVQPKKATDAGFYNVALNLGLTGQVAAGDYLEVWGNGLMHQIAGVSKAGTNPTVLALASPIPFNAPPGAPATWAPPPTKQYRIFRAPRVTGDDILDLPENVVIDLQTNASYGNPLPPQNADGSYDILFSPSGAVITPGLSDTVNLWVREVDQNKPNPGIADTTDGGATIVAVYVRSGLTAAQPPAPVIGANADPYAFLKDGRTSGK
jgi:prepilin-type N-terminal cleavage/methylation domain-containing protein